MVLMWNYETVIKREFNTAKREYVLAGELVLTGMMLNQQSTM
jgi:hypothetical protein